MKKIAIYPGTFDPFTKGHLDILDKALAVFDEVIIAVAKSARKSPCIPFEERLELVKEVLSSQARVRVLALEGVSVEFAVFHKASFICRGVRGSADFEYELSLARMNSELNAEIETVFFPSSLASVPISGTFVREILELQGDVSKFVPDAVVEYFKRKQR